MSTVLRKHILFPARREIRHRRISAGLEETRRQRRRARTPTLSERGTRLFPLQQVFFWESSAAVFLSQKRVAFLIHSFPPAFLLTVKTRSSPMAAHVRHRRDKIESPVRVQDLRGSDNLERAYGPAVLPPRRTERCRWHPARRAIRFTRYKRRPPRPAEWRAGAALS